MKTHFALLQCQTIWKHLHHFLWELLTHLAAKTFLKNPKYPQNLALAAILKLRKENCRH